MARALPYAMDMLLEAWAISLVDGEEGVSMRSIIGPVSRLLDLLAWILDVGKGDEGTAKAADLRRTVEEWEAGPVAGDVDEAFRMVDAESREWQEAYRDVAEQEAVEHDPVEQEPINQDPVDQEATMDRDAKQLWQELVGLKIEKQDPPASKDKARATNSPEPNDPPPQSNSSGTQSADTSEPEPHHRANNSARRRHERRPLGSRAALRQVIWMGRDVGCGGREWFARWMDGGNGDTW